MRHQPAAPSLPSQAVERRVKLSDLALSSVFGSPWLIEPPADAADESAADAGDVIGGLAAELEAAGEGLIFHCRRREHFEDEWSAATTRGLATHLCPPLPPCGRGARRSNHARPPRRVCRRLPPNMRSLLQPRFILLPQTPPGSPLLLKSIATAAQILPRSASLTAETASDRARAQAASLLASTPLEHGFNPLFHCPAGGGTQVCHLVGLHLSTRPVSPAEARSPLSVVFASHLLAHSIHAGPQAAPFGDWSGRASLASSSSVLRPCRCPVRATSPSAAHLWLYFAIGRVRRSRAGLGAAKRSHG